MANSNSVAAQSSSYLQSLVDYILDVKPYHTKLSATSAVSDNYVFADTINVSLSDAHTVRTFLGADLLPAGFSQVGVRERQSFGWAQELISDGVRTTFPIATFSNPKFASQNSLHRFVAGTDDTFESIKGLTSGTFNQKRWDGPGITNVLHNNTHIQDTVGYTLSHGVFSFDVLNTRQWIQSNLVDVPTGSPVFGGNASGLLYMDSKRSGGSLINIVSDPARTVYEEFKVVCTSVSPATLTVYSAVDGFVASLGSVTFGNTFTVLDGGLIRLQFDFTYAPEQTTETAVVGDEWLLTPHQKITVLPTAPVETWSLIKSNPIGFEVGSTPVFTPAVPRTDSPAIEIHTRGFEYTAASTWSVTFTGNGTYELRSSLPGYFADTNTPIELLDGCSYKDDNIAFTIIPTATGWNAGDVFEWTIVDRKAHYKVYGSVSGWQPDAALDEWYWNGKIGFKIPSLSYFMHVKAPTDPRAIFTELKPVSCMAEPSFYTITFTVASDSSSLEPGFATVYHNIHGYRANLETGKPWTDGLASFQIDLIPGEFEFNVGDQILVYLAPPYSYASSGAYDAFGYEQFDYDAGVGDVTVPWLYNEELFPLYHSHGLIIVHNSLTSGDSIIIDKAFEDKIRLKVTGASANYPELGAVDDWIPIHLKYWDRLIGSVPSSNAEFSDLGMLVEAFSAATGNRVFSILSPRYEKTNRSSGSTLTFDSLFYVDYMPFNTRFTIAVVPDQSYGQTIRVKITENLKIYTSIQLILEDAINVTVDDSNFSMMETVSSLNFNEIVTVTINEAGALPANGYDLFGYDTFPYEFDSAYAIGFGGAYHPIPSLIVGYIESSPGVYTWTGDNTDWVIPHPTDTIGISVSEAPTEDDPADDIASASIAEGLTILQTTIGGGGSEPDGTRHLTVLYDFDLATIISGGNPISGTNGLVIEALTGSPDADEYTIKMNNMPGGLSTWIVAEELSPGNPDIPNAQSGPLVYTRFEIDAGVILTDTNSFDLTLPVGISAPFRLWVV